MLALCWPGLGVSVLRNLRKPASPSSSSVVGPVLVCLVCFLSEGAVPKRRALSGALPCLLFASLLWELGPNWVQTALG